jgi:hypothetical protein
MKVDPNRAMKNSNSALVALGSFMDYFAEAASDGKIKSKSAEMISNAIDRDIDAQKANISKKGLEAQMLSESYRIARANAKDDQEARAIIASGYINSMKQSIENSLSFKDETDVALKKQSMLDALEIAQQNQIIAHTGKTSSWHKSMVANPEYAAAAQRAAQGNREWAKQNKFVDEYAAAVNSVGGIATLLPKIKEAIPDNWGTKFTSWMGLKSRSRQEVDNYMFNYVWVPAAKTTGGIVSVSDMKNAKDLQGLTDGFISLGSQTERAIMAGQVLADIIEQRTMEKLSLKEGQVGAPAPDIFRPMMAHARERVNRASKLLQDESETKGK